MGLLSMIAAAFGFGKKEARILVIGLDNSGKTTIINYLKAKKGAPANISYEVTPTVGFQVEEFASNNIKFTVYDMSGQGRYRSLWEQYYEDAQAIIYVLDSTDKLRMCVAKEELWTLLGNEMIKSKNIPVLFFANKIDIPGSLTPDQCMDELDLYKIREKPWHIISSNGLSGTGIQEGIKWLCDQVGKSNRK
jgi:ADP-ribosylation factor-like protein 6